MREKKRRDGREQERREMKSKKEENKGGWLSETSKCFMTEAAFPQLDSYSLTPGLVLNPKLGKYILENCEVIKHVYCRKCFRQIHLLLLTKVTNDPINVRVFLILFSTQHAFVCSSWSLKGISGSGSFVFSPIPSEAFLFPF